MPLFQRINEERERAGLTLDQLAERAGVSKTYLWELENDTKGEKKPSADVLLKLAAALSTTIGELLELPTVRAPKGKIELSRSLIEFSEWMRETKQPLSDGELRELASIRFRGGQPKNRDDWYDLYRTLRRATEK